MNDIAKGILAGGWSLVAGWILPTAINALVFAFFVLPSLYAIPMAHHLGKASVQDKTLAVLAVAVVGGLVLSALQTPLYRVLEGYLLWPAPIARRRRKHYVNSKRILQKRLDVIYYRMLENPTPEDKARLAELQAEPDVSKFAKRDRNLTTVQNALLGERARYPVDDNQVAPTRLGNAIRRFETYGSDRYRLDSQVLWYELTTATPKELRRQIDTARASVDFFVCLLYGQLLVAVTALASLGADRSHYLVLLVTAAVLAGLTLIWYRLAWINTDDWALTVRALVNLGRKPLARSLGLRLPRNLNREREMWLLYCQMVMEPYDETYADALDEFRIEEDTSRQRQEMQITGGVFPPGAKQVQPPQAGPPHNHGSSVELSRGDRRVSRSVHRAARELGAPVCAGCRVNPPSAGDYCVLCIGQIITSARRTALGRR
jgi:hypothetical protein